MTNKMQPEEIVSRLDLTIQLAEEGRAHGFRSVIIGLGELEALRSAAEIVRNHDVVRCGECKKAYITSDCGRKCKCINGKSGYCLDWDFCSEGERKDGKK